jgi:hypothetical protein
MSVVRVFMFLALAALPAAAQDRLDAVAAAVDQTTAAPAAEAAAIDRMARFLDTTPETLRAERASTQLGWGDLFIAHRVATRGGHPVARVVAARRTGAPWGDIASDARVEPEALVQDVAAVWPDAARATPEPADAARRPAPTAPPPQEPTTPGGRAPDVRPGSPSPTAAPSAEPVAEDIRDRMIRGGGGRTR